MATAKCTSRAVNVCLSECAIRIRSKWNQLGQTMIIAIAMHGLNNDSVGLGGRVESDG